jgi:hypothetical protein
MATADYRSAVVRTDGTMLATSKQGVVERDPAGRTRFVRRLRGNQRVTPSLDASHFGVATYADNSPSTLHVLKFEFCDGEGQVQWTLTKPEASDFRLSPRGLWVVGVAGAEGMQESRLFLYNDRGELVRSWNVPYLSDLTIPDRGTRFFAASRRELLAFPYDGGEPESIGRFESFGTSRDGRWVAVYGAGTVSLFDGKTLSFTGKSELPVVRTIVVSGDGRFLAAAGSDRLELHDTRARETAWTVTSGDPRLRFISLDLDFEPLRIVCGLDLDRGPEVPVEQRHTSGAIFVLDSAGTLLWREELSYSDWNFQVPRVRIEEDGSQFDVELASELRQYSLP